MAAPEAQILRQLGPVWLECQDEQGIFYFNSVTQQSSDCLPAELGGRPPAQAQLVQLPQQPQLQPQVSSYTPPQAYAQANCQLQPQPYVMQQGQRYSTYQQQQPLQAQQLAPVQAQSYQPLPQVQPAPAPVVSYQPPPQASTSYQPLPQTQQAMVQVQSYQPLPQTQPAPVQVQSYQQFTQAQPAIAQQPAVQKLQFGDWAVYEDEQGTFYMHIASGQQFEAPTAEIMQAYRQYRAEQDQLHFQQLQQIELQKQQIDQRLVQHTQGLQQQYNMAAVPA